MKTRITLILLILLGGCQSATQLAATGTTANHRIGDDLATIATHANQALPLVTSPSAQQHLKAITVAANDGLQQVPKVDAALASLQKACDAALAALTAERNHWLGYKTRVALWTIGAIAGGAAITIFLMWLLIPAFGPIFAIGVHVFTAGIAPIGAWLNNSIKSRLQAFEAKIATKAAGTAAAPLIVNLTK